MARTTKRVGAGERAHEARLRADEREQHDRKLTETVAAGAASTIQLIELDTMGRVQGFDVTVGLDNASAKLMGQDPRRAVLVDVGPEDFSLCLLTDGREVARGVSLPRATVHLELDWDSREGDEHVRYAVEQTAHALTGAIGLMGAIEARRSEFDEPRSVGFSLAAGPTGTLASARSILTKLRTTRGNVRPNNPDDAATRRRGPSIGAN